MAITDKGVYNTLVSRITVFNELSKTSLIKADAVTFVKEDVLQVQDNLLQLFSINYDFSNTWHAFVSAANDVARKLELAIAKHHFPYGTGSLGIDDTLTATFCCIDLKKKRLVLATKTIQFTGDETTGWQLTINTTNPEIFAFLKKNMANKIYMAVSYLAK